MCVQTRAHTHTYYKMKTAKNGQILSSTSAHHRLFSAIEGWITAKYSAVLGRQPDRLPY